MKLDDVFGIHEESLRLRARRSEVLAANLANADTPGYKARDFDFKAMLRKEIQDPVRLAATHRGHIRPDAGLIASTDHAIERCDLNVRLTVALYVGIAMVLPVEQTAGMESQELRNQH